MRTPTAGEATIQLNSVAKVYGAMQALLPTSLNVRRGEFLTLLGPSGSGKTTLLNIIAGMTSPSGGRVLIDGRDVTDVPPAKRGLGMVFQNYALMPHMNVFRNVAFPLEVRGVPREEIKRRVARVLELVRLPHVAERKPRELSGGQQRCVRMPGDQPAVQFHVPGNLIRLVAQAIGDMPPDQTDFPRPARGCPPAGDSIDGCS